MICWRSSSAPLRGRPSASSVDCSGCSGRPQVVPSNSASADVRQYDSADARTWKSSLSERFVSRERMSTSGLTTSVTPPPRPRVSYNGAASAPGRRGPTNPASAATMTATATTAGQRRRNDVDEPVRAAVGASYERRTAIVTTPTATSVTVNATRRRSSPSAPTNTNSTPPGTSVSARANARKAKTSASSTAIARPMAARTSQPAP